MKVQRVGEEGREVLSAEVTLRQYLNKVMGHAKYGVGFLHSRLNTCKASEMETRSRTARRPAWLERNEGNGETSVGPLWWGPVGQGKDLESEIPFCFSSVAPSALERPPPLNGKSLKICFRINLERAVAPHANAE